MQDPSQKMLHKILFERRKMKNSEVCRIGSLPDEVLIHILSFLSTKEAVQTCVLSKRWKNIWAAVPVVDIKNKDFSVFEDHDCSGDCNEELRMAVARFERFMTGFLDNRAPTNLDRVCCVRHIHSFELDASVGWLDRVALLMPQLIKIFITSDTGHSLDMPHLVFSCASLQYLSMSLYTGINNTSIRPVLINLPSLKILELTFVELHDDFAQMLFKGCPSLERLKLHHCDLNFSGISSEVLKELTLHRCHLYEQMQISCPNLVSLFMRIFLQKGGISLTNMSSLVKVVIILYVYLGDDVPNLNLLGSLSNAAKLELFLGTPMLKEQLEKDIPNCINFNNLKKLVVAGKWDMSYDFYLIACLLKRSPNLKEVNLFFYESQGQIQEPKQDVSGDVLFQYEYLETVKIGHVYGGINGQSKLSSELINAMIKTLGTYVKKIGNMIIT
ncbi:F-box protein At1g60400-like [Carex rostrata]